MRFPGRGCASTPSSSWLSSRPQSPCLRSRIRSRCSRAPTTGSTSA